MSNPFLSIVNDKKEVESGNPFLNIVSEPEEPQTEAKAGENPFLKAKPENPFLNIVKGAISPFQSVVKKTIEPLAKESVITATKPLESKVLFNPVTSAAAYELSGLEKGLTLGYGNAIEKLVNQTPLKNQDIDKNVAESFGSNMSIMAPIGGIFKGISAIAPGYVKNVAPILQDLVKTGVAGSLFGIARKPEEEGIANRMNNAVNDAATFIVLHGAGQAIDTAANFKTIRKDFEYNTLRKKVIDVFKENGLAEDTAIKYTDYGINKAIENKGGWSKITANDLIESKKALSKIRENIKEQAKAAESPVNVTPKAQEPPKAGEIQPLAIEPPKAPEAPQKPQIEAIKTPHEIIAKEQQPDGSLIPIYKPVEPPKPAEIAPEAPVKAVEHPKVENTLIEEARKYKTADEFVADQTGGKFGIVNKIDINKPQEQAYISQFANKFETQKSASGLSYGVLDKMGSLDTALRQRGFKGVSKSADFKGIYSLDKIINNDVLFKKYPSLKKVNVIFADFHTPTQKGVLINDTIFLNSKLYAKNPALIEGSLVHEIEHSIQEIEGKLPKFSQFEQGRGMTAKEYYSDIRENAARKKQQDYADNIKTKSQLTELWNQSQKPLAGTSKEGEGINIESVPVKENPIKTTGKELGETRAKMAEIKKQLLKAKADSKLKGLKMPESAQPLIKEYHELAEKEKSLSKEYAKLKDLEYTPKKPPTFEEITAKETEILRKINPDKKLLQDFLLNKGGSPSLRKIITEGMRKRLPEEEIVKQVDMAIPKTPEETKKVFDLFSKDQAIKDALNEMKKAPPDKVPPDMVDFPEKLKDISGFQGQFRDMYRNFEAVFGKRNESNERVYQMLDDFDMSKGNFIDDQQKFIKEISENVIDKYGFKKGSKESAAIMDFGEKKRDHLSLIREFGEKKAQQIIDSDKFFRKMYDGLLDEINAGRKKIYGDMWAKKGNLDTEIEIIKSNIEKNKATMGSKSRKDTLLYNKLGRREERLQNAINKRIELMNSDEWWRGKVLPKRQDYYHHFQELATGLEGLINAFETPSGISPKLSGVSPVTKPKAKFAGFMQKRKGDESERDAVGGFLNYLPVASYAIHIDPHIMKFRGLASELAKKTEETKNLNNFIEFLQDYANDLAGKSNPADRYLQKVIPGGRTTMRVVNWLNNRIKANVILGNASSSLAQIFNVPQVIGNAKQYSIGGAARSFAQIFSENIPMSKSSFIKERYSKSMYDKFDVTILDKPKQFADWMVGALDEVGTRFGWNSFYEKAIKTGIKEPVRYADIMTRKMVAGRGVGEVPIGQKSKIFQLVAPFQLEVANTWWVMKDFVSAKDFAGLAMFFITSFLMNRVAEKIRGTDVVFDPINASYEGYKAFKGEKNPMLGAVKFGGRVAGEVFSNIPMGQTISGMYPEKGFGGVSSRELFGKGDPSRYGGGVLMSKGFSDPLFKILPPFAGGQIKKTLQGYKAFKEGGVRGTGKNKSFKFRMDDDPLTGLQALAFGQYASERARKYFEKKNK